MVGNGALIPTQNEFGFKAGTYSIFLQHWIWAQIFDTTSSFRGTDSGLRMKAQLKITHEISIFNKRLDIKQTQILDTSLRSLT